METVLESNTYCMNHTRRQKDAKGKVYYGKYAYLCQAVIPIDKLYCKECEKEMQNAKSSASIPMHVGDS